MPAKDAECVSIMRHTGVSRAAAACPASLQHLDPPTAATKPPPYARSGSNYDSDSPQATVTCDSDSLQATVTCDSDSLQTPVTPSSVGRLALSCMNCVAFIVDELIVEQRPRDWAIG